jgi:hypothetical protein
MTPTTDVECGRELAEEIASGLIAEDDLTESGRRKLDAYRASEELHGFFDES